MVQVLDTGIASAQANMDLDADLLETLNPKGEPILHFYEWDRPSATHGHFADPGRHLDLEKAKARGLGLGKRPTGGGIVFHIWDFAFSFLMPSSHPAFSLSTLENYRFVNDAVLKAVGRLFPVPEAVLIPEDFASASPDCRNFCMAKPTVYDVVSLGKKIAGAAQRKKSQGYLHQGTISLAAPALDFLEEVLLSKQAVLEAMAATTFAPLGAGWNPSRLKEARGEVQEHLTRELLSKLSASPYN
jgi:lipoate---protein ligase